MQVKMISDYLLETLFNLLYKLETLRLLAGCSVGLDFCCKTEVVLSVLAALIIAFQPPPCLPCTDQAVLPPEQRHVAFNTTAFCSQFTPHLFRKSFLLAFVAVNTSSLTPPASSEGDRGGWRSTRPSE